MKIENIINYSFCHSLTAQAIVPVPEFCFIVSIPSDHLFFTVSMGMSSMWEPQRPWEISPHIAKLLSQQHISHPESDWVWWQTENADLSHSLKQRLGESISQDWVGLLFIVDLLHFRFSEKYPPWPLNLAEYILVWIHKDLIACGMLTNEKWSIWIKGNSCRTWA